MVFSESGNKRVSRRTHGLLLLYLSKSSWVAEHVCSFLSVLKKQLGCGACLLLPLGAQKP
jgi:hypothetical protein